MDKKGAPAKRTCCRRKRVSLWDTKLMKEQAPAQYARPRFPTMQAPYCLTRGSTAVAFAACHLSRIDLRLFSVGMDSY
jgi:hypothetical protein